MSARDLEHSGLADVHFGDLGDDGVEVPLKRAMTTSL